MDQDILKNNIKYLLESNNLTTLKFANRIGMSQPCVVKWINGKLCPSVYAICAICKEFNVSADWLLFGEEK